MTTAELYIPGRLERNRTYEFTPLQTRAVNTVHEKLKFGDKILTGLNHIIQAGEHSDILYVPTDTVFKFLPRQGGWGLAAVDADGQLNEQYYSPEDRTAKGIESTTQLQMEVSKGGAFVIFSHANFGETQVFQFEESGSVTPTIPLPTSSDKLPLNQVNLVRKLKPIVDKFDSIAAKKLIGE